MFTLRPFRWARRNLLLIVTAAVVMCSLLGTGALVFSAADNEDALRDAETAAAELGPTVFGLSAQVHDVVSRGSLGATDLATNGGIDRRSRRGGGTAGGTLAPPGGHRGRDADRTRRGDELPQPRTGRRRPRPRCAAARVPAAESGDRQPQQEHRSHPGRTSSRSRDDAAQRSARLARDHRRSRHPAGRGDDRRLDRASPARRRRSRRACPAPQRAPPQRARAPRLRHDHGPLARDDDPLRGGGGAGDARLRAGGARGHEAGRVAAPRRRPRSVLACRRRRRRRPGPRAAPAPPRRQPADLRGACDEPARRRPLERHRRQHLGRQRAQGAGGAPAPPGLPRRPHRPRKPRPVRRPARARARARRPRAAPGQRSSWSTSTTSSR